MFRPIHLDPSQSSSEKFHFSIDTSSQWRDAPFTLFFLSFRIIQTTQGLEMAEGKQNRCTIAKNQVSIISKYIIRETSNKLRK